MTIAAFVLDAAVTMWRGDTDTGRRRAILFSVSITLFLVTAVVNTALVNAGVIDFPYIVSFYFMPILVAMSYELSCDLLHSAQLADQLQATADRIA